MTQMLEKMSREDLVEALQAAQAEVTRVQSVVEAERITHDLRVHQIELEMQNRSLRESQAQLEESRSRYADLYDFAPVSYCSLDKDGRVLEANLTTSAFFGFDRATLVGKPLSMLVVPDDRAILRNHLKRCIENGARVSSEVRFTVQGLGPVMFQLVSTPVRNHSGPPATCRTTISDISGLKRSEERLRLLAGISATLGSSFDITQNLAHVVRALVPAFADLAFVDLLERDGEVKRVEVAVSAPAKNTVAEALRRPPIPWAGLTEPLLVSTDAANVLSHVIADVPDRDAIVDACAARSVILVPMLAHTRPVGLLALVSTDLGREYAAADLQLAQDIAARAAMAVDNAKLYQQAQAAVRAREDILSIVSHELKNPLTSITLSADVLLKEGAEHGDRRRGRRNLERVKRGVVHMRNMIEDLLDLSSLESGHLAIEPRPTELRQVVGDAVDLLMPLAHDKHLEVEHVEGPPRGALCDRNRVLQVLSNLIGNAIKFTPENGRITVSIHDLPESRLRVDVHDDGPGIPKQVMLHLFERYWQAKETASKGRGLGLYIAKGIIETMGGTIWVETHATRGTTFSFTLSAVELPKPAKLNHPAGVVMVVDDDDDIRELVTDILEENEYQVVQASNGRRALDYLKSGQPAQSMMLVDLTMPVMDGRELVHAMRKETTFASIPVVLVSSVGNLRDEAEALGAQGALGKPIDIDRLLSMVSQQATATAA